MEKELKKKLRALRKIKKDVPVKTELRRSLNQQICSVKTELSELNKVSSGNPLIPKIYGLNPTLRKAGINLQVYTQRQLEIHYNNLVCGKINS